MTSDQAKTPDVGARLKTLKAWIHWVQKNPMDDDQLEMANTINDLFSLLGTKEAKLDRALAELTTERARAARRGIMEKKKWSNNKHERILQKREFYKDKFAPMTLGEFVKTPARLLYVKDIPEIMDSFITSITVLTPSGAESKITWTERDADKTRKDQGRA